MLDFLDFNVKLLLAELGTRGYGCYCLLVNLLEHETDSLPLNFKTVGKLIGVPAKLVEQVVTKYHLFSIYETAFAIPTPSEREGSKLQVQLEIQMREATDEATQQMRLQKINKKWEGFVVAHEEAVKEALEKIQKIKYENGKAVEVPAPAVQATIEEAQEEPVPTAQVETAQPEEEEDEVARLRRLQKEKERAEMEEADKHPITKEELLKQIELERQQYKEEMQAFYKEQAEKRYRKAVPEIQETTEKTEEAVPTAQVTTQPQEAVPAVQAEILQPEAPAKPARKRTQFVKPTIEEVAEYMKEQNYTELNAEKFWYFYESKDWMVGKNHMKNWRAAVANWHRMTPANSTVNNNINFKSINRNGQQDAELGIRLLNDGRVRHYTDEWE